MSVSETQGAIPARLPWAIEWLASWSRAKLPRMKGFVSWLAQDGKGMSLELSGTANTIMAGHASSMSCDVFFAGELYNQDELCRDLSLAVGCRDAELALSAWQAWGLSAFGRLDGAFALI